MMKKLVVIILMGVLLSVPFTPYAVNSKQVQMANPASVYCVRSGYTLEIRTTADGGQYGVCIFPDGNECEEWAFFRKECGVGYRTLPDINSEEDAPEKD